MGLEFGCGWGFVKKCDSFEEKGERRKEKGGRGKGKRLLKATLTFIPSASAFCLQLI